MSTPPNLFIDNLPDTIRFFTTGNFGNVWSYYNTMNMIATLVLAFVIPGGGLILPILFAILLLRLLIAVVRAYVMLLIHIITGPFQILAGLIPTSQSGFSSWLRNVIAHAAVFLVVPLLFFMSMLFLSSSGIGSILATLAAINPLSNTPKINGFDPNNLPKLPLFGGGSAISPIFGGEVLSILLGYVILLIMPSAVDQTIKAFKAFSFGSANDINAPLMTSYLAAGQMRQAAGQAPDFLRQRGAQIMQTINNFRGGGPPQPGRGANQSG